MKHIFYILAALSLCSLAACTQDPMDGALQEPGRYALLATISPDGPMTRTILLDNPGVRVQTRWTENDAIGLFSAKGEKLTMSVGGSDISEDGKTALFRSSSAIPDGSLTACYPAYPEASLSGSKLSMVFPGTQHYFSAYGLPQPDPSVSLMAGTGTLSAGVSFCNVMAVLKIGQAFDKPTIIKALTFRDLSGSPVEGTISIDLSNNYASELSGGSSTLTLDCGEGVQVETGATGVFYFIIPARTYKQGVEVTFITEDGERMTRTAGTSRGVTFNRGVIYPIGEISNRDYLAGKNASTLADNALMMTPEILRQVQIISRGEETVHNDDGSEVAYNDVPIRAPWYTMMVPVSLGLKKGDYLVFDATDDLPSGGVFQITKDVDTPYADENHSRIEIHLTSDFARAFKNISFGEDMFDAEGNLLEGTGGELDLASYLSDVRDAEGNSIPFSVSSHGEIFLGQDALENAITKAIIKGDKSVTSPKMSITYVNPSETMEASIGASVTVGMRCGIKVVDGNVEFVHFMIHPRINLSASFTLKGACQEYKDYPLLTLYFLPGIPIAPGVILTPELELRAGVGVGGEITFSTSIGYNYDMGEYGLSYLNGQGFTFHHKEAKPSEGVGINPDLSASLMGTLYAQGTISAIPSISLFRVFRAGLYMDFSLKLGLQRGSETINKLPYAVTRLFLTPELTFSPYVATLGGAFTKKWSNLIPKLEFDPIWERHLQPVIEWGSGLDMLGKGIMSNDYKYAVVSGGTTKYYYLDCQEPELFTASQQGVPNIVYQVEGMDYKVKSLKPTLDEWDVVLEVMTGVTNRTWREQVLGFWGSWPGMSPVYTYTNTSRIARYPVMTIPPGQDDKDDISASGTWRLNKDELGYFPLGETRSCHLLCINKRNGEVYEVTSKGPFTYYFPSTPAGSWFFEKEITKEQYDNYGVPVWPDGAPAPF